MFDAMQFYYVRKSTDNIILNLINSDPLRQCLKDAVLFNHEHLYRTIRLSETTLLMERVSADIYVYSYHMFIHTVLYVASEGA